MKPVSIVLTLLLGLASLSVVVWLGRFGGAVPQLSSSFPEVKPVPKQEDLPLPGKGPYGKAEFAETEFNFGVQNVGDTDAHLFAMKNVGEGPLEFLLGKPTCQCTVGEVSQKGPLAPGETVEIEVKWVMKTKNEKFRQVVPIYTTDPDQRTVDIAIVGSVDQPLHVIPSEAWELGDMSTTAPSTAEGFIASTIFSQFELEEVPRENGRVKVKIEPAPEEVMISHQGKSGYVVKIVAGPDVPIGQFREQVKFIAHTPKGDLNVEFLVLGRRKGPIDVKPSVGVKWNVDSNRLLLGEFPASKGTKARLTFFVKGMEQELELQSVEPTNTRIKVTLPEKGKTLGKSRLYQVDFEIPPGPAVNHRLDNAEVLKLKLNHPEAPEFQLSIDYHAI